MKDFILKFAAETVYLFLEISPYLLLGFFFAGIIHAVLGESYIRKHFARSGIVSTIKATVLGIPLPICSCGVIPIAESLKKEGASKSSVMSFLVSTPSSGIDSIMATYALLGPVFAVFRPVASLISGIVVGISTHFTDKDPEPPPVRTGPVKKKGGVREVFAYGFKVLPAEIAQWLIIGVVVGGMISALIPEDFASNYLTTSFLHYLVILLISVPLYVCATGSIPIAASLLMKGILPGAVLAFLIAGPATNTVTLSFVLKRLGKRIAVIYLISIVITSVLLGMLFDFLAGAVQIGKVAGHIHGESDTSLVLVASAIIMIFLLINSKFDLSKVFRQNGGDEMEKIKVGDMNCNHCKMTIEDSLRGIGGIGNFEVRVEQREVRYEGSAAVETVKESIRKAGFSPE